MEVVRQATIVLNNKAIPELSLETKLLYERLKALQHEDVILYEELSKIVGRSVQKYRGNLTSAIRMCLNDHIVIESIRNVGVKRLADLATVESWRNFPKKISRAARLQRKKIISVNFDALPRSAQVEHNTCLSVLGAMSFFAKDNQVKKIGAKVEEALKPLPIGKTLEIFK